ncbi:MAG TPA: hypothetical protein VJV79_05350 [Polyangiaceae bacterium]|nr:hypothetical protein [Polyangiaceae bacterium]
MVSSALRKTAAWSKRHWAGSLFVLLALGIWGWVSWEAAYVRMITWEAGSDYWEHSATLHALIENPWHPRHPHLATNAGSPRFGPQFLLIALIARALHWDALQAMTLCAVLNTLLFLCGIRAFFRSYFRHPLAPLYGLLVMFGGWWLGFHYSNVYALPVFFSVASFPSTTALGLTLLGFALEVRLLRGRAQQKQLTLLVLGLWAAAVFIIHPLTAMMSLPGALLLALAEPKVSWRLRFEVAGAVVVGCALSHFWPYFSPWVVARGGHGEAADWAGQSVQQAADLQIKKKLHEFYQPLALLQALGLGALTLLLLPYFLLRRERWFVGLGALSMLLPFVGNAFVELPLGHRFVLLAIVYLHIGLVWFLLRLTPGHAGAFRFLRRRTWGTVSALLIAATLLVFCGHSLQLARSLFDDPRFRTRRESPVIRNMRAFAGAAGPGAVVLSTPAVSWPLPTFGPKVLVLFHQDPLVPDANQRAHWVRRFLAASTSDDERRTILARYGVSHVLLQREAGSVVRFLAKTSTVRMLGTGYRLYTLSPNAPRATD